MTRHEKFPVQAVSVRYGTPDDVHECMRLALMAVEENALCIPDQNKLLEHFWAALNMNHGVCGVIGEPGQPLEGFVLLRIGPFWYGLDEENVIEEKAIFVHPDHRSARGGRAARLCEFSKKIADELDLPLTIGILSNDRTMAKVRMYQRYFGEPSGAYWIYNGRTGQVNKEVDK